MSIEIKKYGKIKPTASRLHAIVRAKERYGLDLTLADIERIELRIRHPNGDVFFLDRSSKKRSIWIARVEGVNTVVVYNSAQKCISTFLPIWYAKRYFNGEIDMFDSCED